MTQFPSALVAICIPSGDLVHADFAANLAALCLDPGARVGVVNCKNSIIAVGRNPYGLGLAYTYLGEWWEGRRGRTRAGGGVSGSPPTAFWPALIIS